MKAGYKFFGKKIAAPESVPAGTGAAWKAQVRPGGWIVLKSPDGSRRRLMIHEARGRLGVSLEGYLWAGEILQERATSLDSGPGADSELTAQFPGKVRKLLALEGAVVAEGDPILLVEAMKMEFSVKAPSAGKIVRFLVKEGQQISPGDQFLEFEAVNGVTG
ncbi:MAG: hypothetical protein A2X94_16725 [Bdellovibrionales bacterium GWB1_55_8]|nr:MAG: hypothetical protein A2X94_16725 [Bdellovibrionales bacterium GWB1_55_8]